MVMLEERCAGSVITNTSIDSFQKEVTQYLELTIDPSVSGMKLIENRIYDFSGMMIKADQKLFSPTGTASWNLSVTDSKNWVCTMIAGGNSVKTDIGLLNDNILMEYNIAKRIISKSIKVGEIFHDTAFDMMSRESFIIKVQCVAVANKNDKNYHFEITDKRMSKKESWIVDSLGRTVMQDIPPMFTAKKMKCNESVETVKVSEIWEMLKVDGEPCFGDINITLKLQDGLDQSIRFLYENDINSDRIYKFNAPDSLGIYKVRRSRFNVKDWLKSSVTIQKDHPDIKKLAKKHSGRINDRLLIVKNLTFFVYKRLTKKIVGTFSNALETLEAGYGDCGEHAVLLAALLRSQNIPANVVLGLVTVPGKKGYFYHAWVAIPYKNGVIFADAALGNAPGTSGYIPLIIDPEGKGAADLAKYIGNISILCED